MSLSRIDGPFGAMPAWYENLTSGMSTPNLLIDANGEKASQHGYVYAPQLLDGSKRYIRAVEFYWAAVTKGATTAVKLTLQGLSTTTPYPDGVEGSVATIANAALSTGWKTSPDFDVAREVGLYDPLAVVWEFSTFEAGDSLRLGVSNEATGSAFTALYTGAAWGVITCRPNVLLIFTDGSYGIIHGGTAFTTMVAPADFNSGSTPNDRGLRFRVRGEAECLGLRVNVRQFVAGCNFDVLLTDAAGTTLRSLSFIAARLGGTASQYWMGLLFPAGPYPIDPDTDYQLTIKPTTTNNVRLLTHTLGNAAAMPLMAMENLKGVSRTGAGAWTEAPTTLYLMQPILCGIGRGGLSGLTGPNMFTPLVRP